MPYQDDKVRLRHISDAAGKAIGFVNGLARHDFDRDEKLQLALLRLLEIIGEAAGSISDSLQKEHPQIPWREMASTRNRLIHGYFDVDMDVVWQIVTMDLPSLIPQIAKLL